jgi:hypothetical protein
VLACAGLLLALGALLIEFREASRWTAFELTLVIAAPCALLIVLSLHGARARADVAPEPWRALLLIAGVLLTPVALLEALHWLGASTGATLVDAAVLAVTALLALAGATRTRAPFAVLLGGVALLSAWLLVWAKVVGGHPSASTVRWLLLSGGAVLMVAGFVLAWDDRRGSRELVTAGAIGAVGAAMTGVLVGIFGVTVAAVAGVASTSGSTPTSQATPQLHLFGAPFHISGEQTNGWNVVLLAVSLGTVLIAAVARNRGLGYVGAVGLVGFLYSVGDQLTRLEHGHPPDHNLLVWPLLLVCVGLAGLALAALRVRGP